MLCNKFNCPDNILRLSHILIRVFKIVSNNLKNVFKVNGQKFRQMMLGMNFL